MQEATHRGLGARLFIMAYAGAAYVAFLASFTYFILWSLGLLVPQGVNDSARWFAVPSPAAVRSSRSSGSVSISTRPSPGLDQDSLGRSR